jgi:hypothetical protein
MKKPLKLKKMKNENLQYSHENVAENRDFEMARYIWSILKTQLTIIMSWGIDPGSIKVVDLGIQFHVQGFKHTGYVKVALNEGKDLFEISLLSDDGECVKFLDEVYLDMLVDTIDQVVERTEDYEERLTEYCKGGVIV